ncbi:hypothetical protein BDV95DRAFT_606624 [Massariosphaeria phaeospora]|uniref:PWWP domain-containing protein n=1 Tax=Massariosphaeria phaeospora TaxID=100035 RepID=A0A7C8MCI0_9PLEO|nr:hypothetical protein BDV95DRAFT_606624 [Massariosphaeria phaeospora]
MAHLSPGTFVMYADTGSLIPPWPAIVCTDDMAPKAMQQKRPLGYYTLILLMGENQEFRWALTGEMREYDPFYNAARIDQTPGLSQAYDAVDFALDAKLTLDFWKTETVDQRVGDTTVSAQDASLASSSSSDSDDDLEYQKSLQEAIDASLADAGKKRAPSVESDSPTIVVAKRSRNSAPQATSSDIRDHFQSQPSLHWHLPTPSISNPENGSSSTMPRPFPQSPLSSSKGKERQSSPNVGGTLFRDSQSRPNNVGDAFAGPSQKLESSQKRPASKEANVEEELDENGAFVEFVIGPNKQSYFLPRQSITNRMYFADPKYKFIVPKGDKGWIFQRPSLRDIDPEDFDLAAEYLESEDFGHRQIADEDQRAESFAQCSAAWAVAEELGMEDLLQHIAVKIQKTKPWGLEEVWSLAGLVYKMDGTPLPAHEMMKDRLSEYIAENYYQYVAEHTSAFVDRMQRFPELEEDVIEKRTKTLRDRRDESNRS